jgi:hypothetical protein
LEALGVAIKDVASVLAVVLVEPPSDGLVDEVVWDPDRLVILWIVASHPLSDLVLDLNSGPVIIRLTVNCNLWLSWLNYDRSFLFLSSSLTSGGSITLLVFVSWLLFLLIASTLVFLITIVLLLGCSFGLSFLSSSVFLLSLALLDEGQLLSSFLFDFLVVSLLLMIPVLEVGKKLLHVDVWNIVVLGQLLTKEALSSTRRASHKDLNRLEASLLFELLLDNLNVFSEPLFAVPVKFNEVLRLFCLCLLAVFAFFRRLLLWLCWSNEQRAWLHLEVEEQ